jgi:hypothetical protein
MKILLNTDYNISGSEEMRETLKDVIKDAFNRFSEHITSLEVKFRDESSYQYSKNDSVLEALKGMQPLAVTSHKPFNRYMHRDTAENVLMKTKTNSETFAYLYKMTIQ